MADVAVLLFRVRAEVFSVFATPLACAEERRSASTCRDSWRYVMIVKCRTIEVNRPYPICLLAIILFCIISCATVSRHGFSDPITGWHVKSGQLMYHTPSTTLIGEVLVRFS